MGTYTMLKVNTVLKLNTPDQVIGILRYLIGEIDDAPVNLPNHLFFKCDRWKMVLMGVSCYHKESLEANRTLNKDKYGWHISSYSSFKNYDDEIKHFLNWIAPYVDMPDGTEIGNIQYEESYSYDISVIIDQGNIVEKRLDKENNELYYFDEVYDE
jgi:hypothetical protein